MLLLLRSILVRDSICLVRDVLSLVRLSDCHTGGSVKTVGVRVMKFSPYDMHIICSTYYNMYCIFATESTSVSDLKSLWKLDKMGAVAS